MFENNYYQTFGVKVAKAVKDVIKSGHPYYKRIGNKFFYENYVPIVMFMLSQKIKKNMKYNFRYVLNFVLQNLYKEL